MCFWQLELLGQSIYDYIHPCDQEELADLLTPRPGQMRSLRLKMGPKPRDVFIDWQWILSSRFLSVLNIIFSFTDLVCDVNQSVQVGGDQQWRRSQS